jgi:hypothetical protein
MSNNVMNAVLALDSYNRGNSYSIFVPVNHLGNYTFIKHAANMMLCDWNDRPITPT